VLDTAARSGVSLTEFARRHRIDERRLVTWERRLAPTRTTPPPLTFVEVAVPTVASSDAAPRYEIQLATGEILRVEGTPDAETVRTLLAALRGVRRC
jgi:hypothetical protein